MTGTQEQSERNNPLELIRVSEMHHHSGSQIYAHARKTFGLIYVLSGSAVYDFDGTPYPVKAGDLFCIPQKFPFSMRPIEKTYYHTRQFGLMIYDPDLHTRMTTLYPPLTVDSTMKSMLDYIYKFWNIPAQENTSLLEIFLRTILAQFFVKELHYDDPVSAYVLTDGYCPATKKVLCYVESNRYKRLSLDEMSRNLGYNKHYLCSAFSQDTGMSILSYINFLKVRQAMVHFFYWGTGLAEVSELLGFDSTSYFSTLFKSIAGVSPGVFQKACLALDAEDRAKINIHTPFFTSRPMPIDDLFASMQQLVESVTNNSAFRKNVNIY